MSSPTVPPVDEKSPGKSKFASLQAMFEQKSGSPSAPLNSPPKSSPRPSQPKPKQSKDRSPTAISPQAKTEVPEITTKANVVAVQDEIPQPGEEPLSVSEPAGISHSKNEESSQEIAHLEDHHGVRPVSGGLNVQRTEEKSTDPFSVYQSVDVNLSEVR
jgi:hypothetical protein